jgi:hypothetical protein
MLAAAAAERGAPAGALADPLVRVELQNVTNEGADASPNLLPARVGGTKYTLIQPLPWWGKRDLKRQAAEAAAVEAQGRADGAWNDLAARIKTAYALYFQASRQLRINREVLDLLDRLEAIARIRYGGGLAPQADAIRAQVERTAMQGELIGLDTERHHAMLRLNALLARPAGAPLAEPQRLRALPAAAGLDGRVRGGGGVGRVAPVPRMPPDGSLAELWGDGWPAEARIRSGKSGPSDRPARAPLLPRGAGPRAGACGTCRAGSRAGSSRPADR